MTVEDDPEATIFEQVEQVEEVVDQEDPPVEENPQDDPVTTLLSEIKREDGTQKYADVTAAIKSLKESQSYIKTLETENASLKEKLELYKDKAEKNITMEEILSSITASEEGNKEQPSKQPTTQDLKTLFKSFIEEHENGKSVAQNQKTVVDALIKKYGDKDKAVKYYADHAKEIGVGVEFLNDVAGRSPKAALKLLGLDEKKEVVGTEDIVPSVSTERWRPTNPNKTVRSVMGGGSSADLLSKWNEVKAKVAAS